MFDKDWNDQTYQHQYRDKCVRRLVHVVYLKLKVNYYRKLFRVVTLLCIFHSSAETNSSAETDPSAETNSNAKTNPNTETNVYVVRLVLFIWNLNQLLFVSYSILNCFENRLVL